MFILFAGLSSNAFVTITLCIFGLATAVIGLIENCSSSVIQTVGSDARFSCSTSEATRIRWDFNGRTVYNGYRSINVSKYQVFWNAASGRSELNVRGVNRDDVGAYSCSEDANHVNSESAHLLLIIEITCARNASLPSMWQPEELNNYVNECVSFSGHGSTDVRIRCAPENDVFRSSSLSLKRRANYSCVACLESVNYPLRPNETTCSVSTCTSLSWAFLRLADGGNESYEDSNYYSGTTILICVTAAASTAFCLMGVVVLAYKGVRSKPLKCHNTSAESEGHEYEHDRTAGTREMLQRPSIVADDSAAAIYTKLVLLTAAPASTPVDAANTSGS